MSLDGVQAEFAAHPLMQTMHLYPQATAAPVAPSSGQPDPPIDIPTMSAGSKRTVKPTQKAADATATTAATKDAIDPATSRTRGGSRTRTRVAGDTSMPPSVASKRRDPPHDVEASEANPAAKVPRRRK